MRLPSPATLRSGLAARLRLSGSPLIVAGVALAATAAVAAPMAGTMIADDEEREEMLDDRFGQCRNLALFDQMGEGTGGDVPVLLLPDSARSLMWSQETGQTHDEDNDHITGPGMLPTLTALPDVHVQVLYPSLWADSWPMDTSRLVEALTCLHEDSGEEVIVVAHGIAGIALWDALASSEAAEDAVAMSIAIGVPFEGSDYVFEHDDLLDEGDLPELGDPAYDGEPSMEALAHECARYDSAFNWSDQVCHRHRRVAESPLGHALAEGQVNEDALGRWPDMSEVRVIAGEIEVVEEDQEIVDGELVDIPDEDLEVLGESLGDGFVSSRQANAVPNVAYVANPVIARCPEERVHGSNLIYNRCFGDQLLTNQEVIDQVATWVARDVEQRALTALYNGISFEIDCGDGPRDYSLWDGEYVSEDEGGAAVRLIDVELVRGEEQNQVVALALLSCWYGVGTEHEWPGSRTDVLHAYHLEGGEWVPAADPIEASYITASGDPAFDDHDRLIMPVATNRQSMQRVPEAFDRQPGSDGRNADCCPSGWSRVQWRVDPDHPDIFIMEWGDQALVFGDEGHEPGSPDHVEDRDADWQPRRPDAPDDWDVETPAQEEDGAGTGDEGEGEGRGQGDAVDRGF